ncbi:MAG: polyprenol monophosphomannose synthase [Deltaproteobacteria bacterium]|jgi:dolichol-phosphate mannosyltransferase|nr:polyprenol monophosphomannose synthase [Deltaproteobacteria bacterium]
MADRALIIIPTYDERDNVEEIAAAALAAAESAEILFVDDNSPDGTGNILDRMAEAEPRIHVVHRAGKEGLGTAYLAGFQWGLERGYDYLLEMDADFSHDPKYLPGLIQAAREGADMVIGSRYVEGGGTVNWGLGRQFISRAGGLYARTILGMPVQDPTAGFVCYRRTTLEAIDLDAVHSNGYSFQIEMKYRVLKAGLTIVEVPIVFEDRRVGQSKMSRAIFGEALLMVWRLRFKR